MSSQAEGKVKEVKGKVKEQWEIFLETYIQSLTNRDPDRFSQLFEEDGSFEDPVGTPALLGRASIHKFISKVMEKPSIHPQILQSSRLPGATSDKGDIILTRFRFGMVTDNSRRVMEGMHVFEMSPKGKISKGKAYWNPEDLLRQPKVVIVTGGGSGIGMAIAKRFSDEGYQVVLADRNEELGKKVAAQIQAIFVKVDVGDPKQVENLVFSTYERFKRLDVMVNNAGIIGKFKSLEETPIEYYKEVQSVNLDGVFYGLKYAIQVMRKQGFGAIVNTSSITSKKTLPGLGAYASTKAAVCSLTQSAALENVEHNIRINAVLPSFVNTPLLEQASSSSPSDQQKENQKRFKTVPASKIANAVFFLAGDQADRITGHSLPIDDALLAHL